MTRMALTTLIRFTHVSSLYGLNTSLIFNQWRVEACFLDDQLQWHKFLEPCTTTSYFSSSKLDNCWHASSPILCSLFSSCVVLLLTMISHTSWYPVDKKISFEDLNHHQQKKKQLLIIQQMNEMIFFLEEL